MSVEILVNVALGDLVPAPLVLPYERLGLVRRERILAVWCEEELGHETLYQRVQASRGPARVIRRPLAIYSDTGSFDLSVTGIVEASDQWWVNCQRRASESLEQFRERMTLELDYCPLRDVVLLVGLSPPPTTNDAEEAAYLFACAALAHERPDVVGVVWLGAPTPAVLEALEAVKSVVRPPPYLELPAPLLEAPAPDNTKA